MSRVKVKLNTAGVRALLLQGEGIMAECERQAAAIARRAGEGYETDAFPGGKTRGNVRVYPATGGARRDNLRNNTLIKSLRGGGDG